MGTTKFYCTIVYERAGRLRAIPLGVRDLGHAERMRQIVADQHGAASLVLDPVSDAGDTLASYAQQALSA